MKKFILFCYLVMSLVDASSQRLSVGGGLAIPTYWGDLNSGSIPTDVLNSSGLGVNLGALYQINNHISGQLQINFGTMKGDDANSSKDFQLMRNLRFRSRFFSASAKVNVGLFTLHLPNDKYLIPMLTLGVNRFYTNPYTTYNNQRVYLAPLGTEGQGLAGYPDKYSSWHNAASLGGSLKYQISDKVMVLAQLEFNVTDTDYIDDVGPAYVSYSELLQGNGQLAAVLSDRTPEYLGTNEPGIKATGAQRGGKAKDAYFLSTLSVYYSIGASRIDKKNWRSKIQCPKF